MKGKIVTIKPHPEFGEGLCTMYSPSLNKAFICFDNDDKKYHYCDLEDVEYVRDSNDEDLIKYQTKR